MAYNLTDTGLDLNYDIDPEERKRREELLALQQGKTLTTQPIQPIQPEVVQQQTQQPSVALSPEQEKQIQQLTQTTTARAINPNEVVQEVNQTVLPTAGEPIQVAGKPVVPPQPSTGTGLKLPPGYTQPTEQPYIDQFNKGDLYSLVNPNAKAPDYIRTAAQEQLMENFRQQKIKNDVEERINNASKNPQDIFKVFDEFKKSKSEDGSYVRAFILNKFGFTEAANDEMSKLGWGAKYEHTLLPNGEAAMVKYSRNGEPIAGIGANGKKLTPEELIGVGSMKGATTGQTMGFDNKGHVISHTTIPGGKAVIWKDETTGERLAGAPEGYHTGKNQQEVMAIQAYQRSRQNDEAKNRANIAKGLAPLYTNEQMEERAQNERSRIMGIPTTTYGATTEPAGVTPTVTPTPTVGQSAVDWAKQNNIPVSVQGGTRTSQEQANQLAQWYSGGMKGPRPAEPGTSKHETGNAIDVPKEGRTPENLAKLKAAGFVNNVPGDPWHFERVVKTTPQVGAGAPTVTEIQLNNAKAIANYESPPLTGTGMNSQNAIIMAKVRELNPDFDASKFKIAQKTRQDFITGKQGQSVQSMNVAVDHLDTLQEAANALQNGNVPLFNQIGNMYSKNTGSPAVTDFNALKSIVGSEVAKAVAGGATALGDREEIRAEINAANSPQQLAGVIEKYQKLMAGQVKGLKQTYESAGLKDFDEKLLPRTKKVLNSVQESTRSKW